MTWEAQRLAEHCDTITKGTTPTSLGMNFTESGIPFVRVQNLVGGSVEFQNDDLFIDVETHHALRRSKIFPGDLLLSIAGTIGRCAIVPEDVEELNCNQAVAIIRPKKSIDRRFLMHWISSRAATDQISQSKVTATISNLSLGQIGELKIPLPPLEEQKRLAAILDQADELRRKRKRALDRLGQLRNAIFMEMFGDPKTNPKVLPKVELGELVKVSSGVGLTASDQNGGDYPVYGGNGVNGWHDDFTVPAGTVVIGRVGVYCGAVHVTDRDAWVTDNALIVTLKRPVNRTYLAAALKIANLNQYAGRSAQPLVSGSRIYPIEILHPSIAQQELFEARVLQAEAVSVDCSAASIHIKELFAALQHRAFRGEL